MPLRSMGRVTLVLLLLGLCIIKTAGYDVEVEEDGTYTLSVSCSVELGQEKTDTVGLEMQYLNVEPEKEGDWESKSAHWLTTCAWKVDPLFAACGIALIIGAILILISCIRTGDF